MNEIIWSKEKNPYYNVALEYELMHRQEHGVKLFLWQNVPSVFVGRNQNLHMECDVEYLKEQKILPVRRFSGGGAVFQDEGNLNFSFVCPAATADVETMKEIVEHAIESFGIACTFTGRNDLLADGKKFSGHAYYEEDGKFLYHGTLLCDVDLNQMVQVLKPSRGKLESKGIASVRSRVINLTELNASITLENLGERLATEFWKVYGTEKPLAIKFADRENYRVSEQLLGRLESDAWIYGQTPDWSICIERRFDIGLVSVSASVHDGKIDRIQINTDSLQPIDFWECEKHLLGRRYVEEEIFDDIEKTVLS